MAKKYKKKYYCLKEQYNDLYEHMLDIQADKDFYTKEIHYFEAFIEWKNLTDEFSYFQNHAYEKTTENLPFSTLTL